MDNFSALEPPKADAQLVLDKRDFEKKAFQNLPKGLVNLQKKIKTYKTGNYFLFELLTHPFITAKILKMFEGKSLLKMALFLKKKSQVNFDCAFGYSEFDRIFNHPDLDMIRVKGNGQSKKKRNSEKAGKSPRDAKKKPKRAETGTEHPSQTRFFGRLEEEESKLKTRIRFENEKLKNLLFKNDDILELKLLISKMNSLQSRIDKSRIRVFFEELLETLQLNLCVSYDGKNCLFLIRNSETCEKGNVFHYKSQEKRRREMHFRKKPCASAKTVSEKASPGGTVFPESSGREMEINQKKKKWTFTRATRTRPPLAKVL